MRAKVVCSICSHAFSPQDGGYVCAGCGKTVCHICEDKPGYGPVVLEDKVLCLKCGLGWNKGDRK